MWRRRRKRRVIYQPTASNIVEFERFLKKL